MIRHKILPSSRKIQAASRECDYLKLTGWVACALASNAGPGAAPVRVLKARLNHTGLSVRGSVTSGIQPQDKSKRFVTAPMQTA